MASDKGRPIPRFGEGDANNHPFPAVYPLIFNEARDDKKTIAAGGGVMPERNPLDNTDLHDTPKEWANEVEPSFSSCTIAAFLLGLVELEK